MNNHSHDVNGRGDGSASVFKSVDHAHFMQLAINEARKSPPKPSNFRVGAVLVDEDSAEILSTGYTLELPGNTHAEQCCLQKYAARYGLPDARVGEVLPARTVIYTTMEPCVERLSGNLPCVDRILRTQTDAKGVITKVYSGVQEPDTFVKKNSGRARLESNGIECVHVPGFEQEILLVATAGHDMPAPET